MRASLMPMIGVAVATMIVAGCAERKPAEPLKTDGVNQVVFSVPGMT